MAESCCLLDIHQFGLDWLNQRRHINCSFHLLLLTDAEDTCYDCSVQRNRNKSLQRTLPVVIPVGGPDGKKWEKWDTEEAAKHWVLGHCVSADTGYTQLLREISRADSKNFERYKKALTLQGWDFLLAIKCLKRAIGNKDSLAIKKYLAHLLVLYRDVQQKSQQKSQRPWADLVRQASLAQPDAEQALQNPNLTSVWVTQFIERFLSRTRLTCWVRDGTADLEPAIYCPELGTAIAVHLILNGGFGVCPHCGKTFVGEGFGRSGCCSVPCREAHRVARHRAANSKKKGR